MFTVAPLPLPLPLIDAEAERQRHSIIEQVIADLNNGPLAHPPSGTLNCGGTTSWTLETSPGVAVCSISNRPSSFSDDPTSG